MAKQKDSSQETVISLLGYVAYIPKPILEVSWMLDS